jgi:hypothetical protein
MNSTHHPREMAGFWYRLHVACAPLRSFPALLGELAFMLWLVIKGAKPPTLDPASSPAVAD